MAVALRCRRGAHSRTAKSGADSGEHDARQVFDRLAGAWTYWGWKGSYFDSAEDASAFFDEVRYMLATQKGAPNSPQWFNTGLHWAYGIEGPSQGHYYVDHSTDRVRRSSNAFEHPQAHSCFIQSIEDDLVGESGILSLLVDEARIAKFGSGTGANFSKIRGSSESLSGGGKACGLVSVLRAGDRAAALITAKGSTRRASKMIVVDVDHPDIEEYIDWKVKEEQKVAALVTGSKTIAHHLTAIMQGCPILIALAVASIPPKIKRSTDKSAPLGERWFPRITSAEPLSLPVRAMSTWRSQLIQTIGTRTLTLPFPVKIQTIRSA